MDTLLEVEHLGFFPIRSPTNVTEQFEVKLKCSHFYSCFEFVVVVN